MKGPQLQLRNLGKNLEFCNIINSVNRFGKLTWDYVHKDTITIRLKDSEFLSGVIFSNCKVCIRDIGTISSENLICLVDERHHVGRCESEGKKHGRLEIDKEYKM